MIGINAAHTKKTVADPVAEYTTLQPLWNRSRAVCRGERYVKAFDSFPHVQENMLIPFSPSMTDRQYDFYKKEAELPGIVAQFSKMLVGGLLRKQPIVELPKEAPEEALDWIMNNFGQDDSSLVAFLDEALFEEFQTSRAWVYVDFPSVPDFESLSLEERSQIKPYPVLWNAELVINWRVSTDRFGKAVLSRVITRGFEEVARDDNEFHPDFVDTVRVHELDENGYYQIRIFREAAASSMVEMINGRKQSAAGKTTPAFVLEDVITDIMSSGERLKMIPAWPLNGAISPSEPILTPLIDKEISLYNKISRRNHLLYGAATYTPVISTDMPDEDFEEMVNSGLGTWLRLRQGDTATVLQTPTEALQDMDRAISAGIEEMAKLGIRMLTPETAQSGVALEIRNAAQNAQLGTFNTKVSNVMRQVVCFMLNWRYGLNAKDSDVKFELSADFNPTPLGADWLRLATEWYQQGLVPRSVWLQMLKQNDMLAPDYNDEQGRQEITADMDLSMKSEQDKSYEDQIKQQ